MNINGKNKNYKNIDISEIYTKLSQENRTVSIYQIDDQIFMYRTIGRFEYKELVENEDINDSEKEEVLCDICVLFPEEYDFEDCDAGVPTTLAKKIIEASGLDSLETRKNIMNFYRNEMYDIDNQIVCMINEAFPNIDIEEIETWDLEQLSKYLSRAEWKLANLRGMDIYFDPMDNQEEQIEQEVSTEELTDNKDNKKDKNMLGQKKEKLTPEKLNQLKNSFPDINWEDDAILRDGIDGMNGSVDTTVAALRPGM